MKSIDAQAAAIVDCLKRAFAPRDKRLSALEQRLAVLEGRPSVEYAGIHNERKTYQPGQLVTRRGLWLARCATSTVPGTDHTSWTLVCKEKP
jgi:hypothetical protein